MENIQLKANQVDKVLFLFLLTRNQAVLYMKEGLTMSQWLIKKILQVRNKTRSLRKRMKKPMRMKILTKLTD